MHFAFDRMKEAFEKVAKGEAKKLITVPSNHDKKYIGPAAHCRANRGTGRRYDVILVPAFSQFPDGRLRLVGLWRDKAYKLVVCYLWRKIRLEATKQALGGGKQAKV